MALLRLRRDANAVWHSSLRELRNQLLSPKGRVVMLLFALLGVLPTLLRSPIVADAGYGPARDEVLQNQQLVALFGLSAAIELAKCPTLIMAMGVMVLIALPLAAVLLAYDAVADDVERGVSRFVLMRAPRAGYLVGKLLGLWVVFALLLALLFAASASIVSLSPGAELSQTLWWSLKFWLVCSAMCFPYLSLALFISAAALPASRALALGLGALLLLAVGRGFALRVSGFAGRALFPGSYDALLLSFDSSEVWMGVLLLSLWGAFWGAAGIAVMSLRDV